MTRINVAILPSELNDKHLIAEHREIKRIPNTIKTGKAVIDNIPTLFTLGKGHVKFFYNKLKYLHERYDAIHRECMKRGFNVTYYGESFKDLPTELYNDYIETVRDRAILLERLIEKDRNYGKIRL